MKFIKIDESFSKIGQLTNCFYSFFRLDGTLHSVHRRHRLFSFDNWPQTESENLSQIILTEYLNNNPNQISSEEVICKGNDPRVASDGHKAYVLSEGAVHSGVLYTLTTLPEKKNVSVKLGDGVERGKNWQPVIKNENLYIIDSISPFKINILDIHTGLITKVNQVDTDFNLKASHDNYSILRGGSNAIAENDILYGWGHATVSPYCHVPFILGI
jgi:hypothetical protein